MLGFTDIVLTEQIGSTPAAVNRRTGVLYINPTVFFAYPPAWQQFIVLHELGHLRLQTTSEDLADEFAFRHFVRNGGSLEQAVLSLSEVLDVDQNPIHYQRAKKQLDRAIEFDKKVNGINIGKISKEKAMCNTAAHKNRCTVILLGCIQRGDAEGARAAAQELALHADPQEQENLVEKFNGLINQMEKPEIRGTGFLESYDGQDSYLSFLGMGKKAQERRDTKVNARAELIKAKAAAKTNRSLAAMTKADAKKTLADQGIRPDGIGEVFKGLGDLTGKVGGLLGKGGDTTNDQNSLEDYPAEETPKKSNKGIIIAIVVILIIALGVGGFFLFRKKK